MAGCWRRFLFALPLLGRAGAACIHLFVVVASLSVGYVFLLRLLLLTCTRLDGSGEWRQKETKREERSDARRCSCTRPRHCSREERRESRTDEATSTQPQQGEQHLGNKPQRAERGANEGRSGGEQRDQRGCSCGCLAPPQLQRLATASLPSLVYSRGCTCSVHLITHLGCSLGVLAAPPSPSASAAAAPLQLHCRRLLCSPSLSLQRLPPRASGKSDYTRSEQQQQTNSSSNTTNMDAAAAAAAAASGPASHSLEAAATRMSDGNHEMAAASAPSSSAGAARSQARRGRGAEAAAEEERKGTEDEPAAAAATSGQQLSPRWNSHPLPRLQHRHSPPSPSSPPANKRARPSEDQPASAAMDEEGGASSAAAAADLNGEWPCISSGAEMSCEEQRWLSMKAGSGASAAAARACSSRATCASKIEWLVSSHATRREQSEDGDRCCRL